MLRDTMGRFAKSGFVRKSAKWVVLGLIVWFSVHSFFVTYKFVNSNGVHGIVAKATYNAMLDDHAKAQAFDSVPDENQYRALME